MTKENIEYVQAGKLVESNMMQYSAYVLLHRAIPDLRDGLKPVYRRILFTMWNEKITRFSKSANITGKVMLVHPHGDTYGTLVGMAQKDKHMNPFIESKGNFGSYLTNGIAPAAARYTESKLGEYALDMMKDIPKGSVPIIDNYDATIKMPEVMPTRFPTILEFSQSGIGVGFSSSTLGMNTSELADALIKYLKTGEHTQLVPDFITGGFIVNEPENFEKINKEGRGSVRIRSNFEIDALTITITQIPYGAKRDKIIKKIIELAKTDKLREVAEVKDLTGIKGQKIVVRGKRGTNMKVLMEKLYRYTDLEKTASANMNIIINQLPRVLSVEKVIEEWIDWRRSVIKKEAENDLVKVQAVLSRMYALNKILNHVDELIEIIRKSPDDEIEPTISKRFGVDLEQASYIANMRLRSISKENIQRQVKKIEETEAQAKSIEELIASESKQNEKMIEDFTEHKKKFGKPRQSQIIDVEQVTITPTRTRTQAAKEVESPVTISISREGYVFVAETENDKLTLKPGDEIVETLEAMTSHSLNIISRDNNVYSFKISDLKKVKQEPRGNYMNSLESELDPIKYYVPEIFEGCMVYALPEGRIAVLDKKVFEMSGRRKTKNAFNESLPPIEIVQVKPTESFIVELENGKTIEGTLEKYSPKRSRISQGVKVSNHLIKSIYLK